MNRRSLICTSIACALVACSRKSPEPVTPVAPAPTSLRIVTGPAVNQYNGAANPVVLRLYQLRSRSEFEAASFIDIFNNNSPDLAGAVIDKRSLASIYPMAQRQVDIDLLPGVFYLGVFAEFADFETQQFRAVTLISNAQLDAGITVTVSSSGISIQMNPVAVGTFQTATEGKKEGLLKRLLGEMR